MTRIHRPMCEHAKLLVGIFGLAAPLSFALEARAVTAPSVPAPPARTVEQSPPPSCFERTPMVAVELEPGRAASRTALDDWWTTATVADVERCMLAGPGIAARDEDGNTWLHFAARYNAGPEVVRALLDAGAGANARNRAGWTPLHFAAERNEHGPVIALLLSAGAEIEARHDPADRRGSRSATPLYLAALHNHSAPVIGSLLGANPDLEAKGPEGTPLIVAAYGNTTALRALLEAGADVDTFHAAKTALHIAAARFSEVSVIEMMLSFGANPNAQQDRVLAIWGSPLHDAARHTDNPAVVEALLDAGADPSAKDYDSRTPFWHAERNPALNGTPVYWRLNEGRFR